VWIDPHGQPLPFHNDEEALDFLRQAQVVERVRIEEGINRPYRLLLEAGGVQAHAIFRDVDRLPAGEGSLLERRHRGQDSYRHEAAAYQLSRLLGLDRVPPTVLRELDGQAGSMQLWIEGARTEKRRVVSGEAPRRPALHQAELRMMAIFDALIDNFDRNPGNAIEDPLGRLWWVDHTRAFRARSTSVDFDHITSCEKRLYQRLQTVSREEWFRVMRPHLDAYTLDALWLRRTLLVQHLTKLARTNGEETVLYETQDLGALRALAVLPPAFPLPF
jgi:hypothetical protein